MVSSVRIALFAFAVTLIALVPAESKKCYKCADIEDCKKTNATLVTIECSKKCVKIDNSKGQAVIRDCMDEEGCKLFRNCYSCTGETCNSSSSIGPSFLIIGLIGAVLAKYY